MKSGLPRKPVSFLTRQQGIYFSLEIRKGNVYVADFNSTSSEGMTCLFSKACAEESWLWHKKLSHLNFKAINLLVKKDLVRGLPKLWNSPKMVFVMHAKSVNKERHPSKVRQNHQLMSPYNCFIWICLVQSTSCQLDKKKYFHGHC